jgi:hypothetical protein
MATINIKERNSEKIWEELKDAFQEMADKTIPKMKRGMDTVECPKTR